jgi:hypothetical protein
MWVCIARSALPVLLCLLVSADANAHCPGCRNAKRMPDDVKDAIRNLAQEYGNMPLQEANDWLNDMEKNKRFQLETWS